MSQPTRNSTRTFNRIIQVEDHEGGTKYARERAHRRCIIAVVPTAHLTSSNTIKADIVFTLPHIPLVPESRSKTIKLVIQKIKVRQPIPLIP